MMITYNINIPKKKKTYNINTNILIVSIAQSINEFITIRLILNSENRILWITKFLNEIHYLAVAEFLLSSLHIHKLIS